MTPMRADPRLPSSACVPVPSRSHRPLTAIAALLVTLLVALSQPGGAQTAQPVSLHASAFTTQLTIDGATTSNGIGGEVQLRFTSGLFSVGIGGQLTTHPSLQQGGARLAGVLVEPRLVIDVGRNSFAPYVAARLGYVRVLGLADASTEGFDAGGGAGFIVPLTSRVNLDVGGALVRSLYESQVRGQQSTQKTSFQSMNYAAKVGLSVGL